MSAVRPGLILPGVHPDPSIVRVGEDYYLANSSFEYLPGIPIHRSTDLVHWTLIGHVATRPEQVEVERAATPGGVWAPTLRHHDGLFHLVVTVFDGRGCVLFRAARAEGPWDDGVVLEGVEGIDPDLAWDDDGTAYVTTSIWGRIDQVRVDLATGRALEAPRTVWQGTDRLAFTEGPHLFHRGDHWYLLVAEGGTDRGHAVSVARSARPDGPFEPCPWNPVLTAAGSDLPVQNQGHADLVDLPDGGTAAVLLAVRPVGLGHSFSPVGRETFLTTVEWTDGWPVLRPIDAVELSASDVDPDLGDAAVLDDPEWLGIRRLPASVARPTAEGLVLEGDGAGLGDPRPCFLGRRVQHLESTIRAVLDVRSGRGGLAVRITEDCWYGLDARIEGEEAVVTATAVIPGLNRTWEARVPAGDVELVLEHTEPPHDFTTRAAGGDRIRLLVGAPGSADEPRLLVELDGRHWSFETAKAFTGRVYGVVALAGSVLVRRLTSSGR